MRRETGVFPRGPRDVTPEHSATQTRPNLRNMRPSAQTVSTPFPRTYACIGRPLILIPKDESRPLPAPRYPAFTPRPLSRVPSLPRQAYA